MIRPPEPPFHYIYVVPTPRRQAGSQRWKWGCNKLLLTFELPYVNTPMVHPLFLIHQITIEGRPPPLAANPSDRNYGHELPLVSTGTIRLVRVQSPTTTQDFETL